MYKQTKHSAPTMRDRSMTVKAECILDERFLHWDPSETYVNFAFRIQTLIVLTKLKQISTPARLPADDDLIRVEICARDTSNKASAFKKECNALRSVHKLEGSWPNVDSQLLRAVSRQRSQRNRTGMQSFSSHVSYDIADCKSVVW